MPSKYFVNKELGVVRFTANNNSSVIAMIDYDVELLKKAKSRTWTFVKKRNNRYFKYGDQNYYLQFLVIDHYFEEGVRIKLREQGFHIDHINNNGLDNRLGNLQFLLGRENTQKGRTTDKEMREVLYKSRFGISIYKDFNTKLYILTIEIIDEFKRYDMLYESFEILKHDIDITLKEIRENNYIKSIFESENYLLCILKVPDNDFLARIEEKKELMTSEERKRGGFVEIDGGLVLLFGESVLNYKPAPLRDILQFVEIHEDVER